MELHWLAVLGCLCVLAAPGHFAAVPTQDTLVVSRSEDAITEVTTEEPTTEGPAPPIKLTEMEVISEVSLRYAHTVVVARVRNPAKRAQEANFRVLLPETAFISGFVMTIDGKSYKAYVKGKEEAKQIYDQAVSQGFGAAHVTAKARDSNQFVVNVNIEPSSSAVFNLTYEELLVRRNDVYNHAINLHPGAVVPKLSVTVHIKEAQKITDLRVPDIRTGNEIDATKDDAQNSKAVITRGHDDREATITFNPDLEEQKRLMGIYAEKAKESASHVHVWNRPSEESHEQGVLGQFVVQYDVERPKDGEILVNDGYFVHFFAPKSLPPLNKYVVFVLDTSGSMMDRKIIQLREAMQTILSDLNPGDYFSIVEFASSVTIHELKEADQEPKRRVNYYWGEVEKKPTLVPPSPATPQNIEKAKVIISRLNAAGGTNIDSALDVAVNLIHKRTEWGKKKTPTNETETAIVTTEVTKTQEEDVDAELYNVEKMKTLEPIIIFLTDGDPTVGQTSTTVIINRLTEKNFGEGKATIFSLAFGEDADRKFLRKLSLRNDGFMRHIYEAADAALQLRDFYRQVSSPLLADVKFVYPANQVKEGTLTKNTFRTFYSGSEVVVAGQVADGVEELTPQVLGFCAVDDGFGRKRYEKLPKAPVPAKSDIQPLERLWSYLTIKQLLDERDATEGDNEGSKENRPEAKALALALKYEFVTPLTSLVVVKPNATNAVDAESVDKPVSMPFAPQSINFAPAGPPGHAYSSGFAAASPVYASQALSLDSPVEEEEIDHYDIIDEVSNGHRHSWGSSHSYPSSHGFSSSWSNGNRHSWGSSHSYPSSHGFSSSSSGFGSGSAGMSFNQAYRTDKPQPSFYPISTNIGRPAFPSVSDRSSLVSPLSGNFNSDHGSNTGSAAFGFAAPSSDYSIVGEVLILTTIRPIEVSTTESSIARYRLQEFAWTEPLLNSTADALVLEVNGTNVDLKLSKDAQVPKKSDGDATCDSAVDGGAGVCVYLTRCESAKNISVDTYKTTYCSVNEGYAGVCCSLQKVDVVTAR